MKRELFTFSLAALLTSGVSAATVTYTGANGGDFNTGTNWDTTNAPVLDGTDDVVINNGNSVDYEPGGDFLTLAGSDVSISNGSSWVTDNGNWTRINGNLSLDNGSFTRNAGGVLAFGSNDGGPTGTINVDITNGSSISTQGELWFGWSGGASNFDLTVTINDGSLTSTGGGGASWFLWDSDDATVNYVVNFTGTGTISVAAAGININSNIPGVNTYEDLWDAGILQANGSNDGEFSDFFTVTGTAGQDNYTLTSNVPEPGSLALLALGGLTMLRRRR